MQDGMLLICHDVVSSHGSEGDGDARPPLIVTIAKKGLAAVLAASCAQAP
jgi:hypothetical protein